MIWLLRHGDAEDGEGKPDADRDLTRKGERQARDAGAALRALGVELDVCLASPKVRARRTAELACEALAAPVELDDRLAGGDFDPLELSSGRGEVMLVGHEPDFSGAVAFVTGSRVKMKKGGIAALDDHLLHILLRPKDLSRIAGN
ncbi:MAG TPA: histidine phosphatase family protein [Solirubrobacterales bacterium]|jgi:phosphohistidine phosphatase|nr:histidine phosphatase family protein [Solirubrobacterales bacterium]